MKIIICIIFNLLVISSCQKSHIPTQNKNEIYNFDVVYVYDEYINTFSPNTFLYLFQYKIPLLTKEVIGYNVKFNISFGTTEKDFYNSTKSILRTNQDILKNSYLNITDIKDHEVDYLIGKILSEEHVYRLYHLFNTTNRLEIIEKTSEKNLNNIKSILNMSLPNRDKLFQNQYPFLNRAFYWRMVCANYKNADIIIINMPIVSLNKMMNVKDIADYGFTDRIIAENTQRELNVSSVISTYPLLSKDALFNSLRETAGSEEQVDIFSYYIVQTLAMMLVGYDTIENEPNSIMNEIIGFNYNDWYSNIKNSSRLRPPYKTLKKFPHSYTGSDLSSAP